MTKKNAFALFISFCGLLFSGISFAEDAHMHQHISAGDRALSIDQRVAESNERNALIKGSEGALEEASLKSAKGMKAYKTSHNGAYHNLLQVSIYGDIELHDGSVWKASFKDAYKILSWFDTDTLVILPNHKWFSSYQFKILNLNTSESVLVDMIYGPYYEGALTRWIIGVNYSKNIVYLSDGTVWDMSMFDGLIISNWLPNDTVIIGINNGLLSRSNPNILINVNMLNYATGKAKM